MGPNKLLGEKGGMKTVQQTTKPNLSDFVLWKQLEPSVPVTFEVQQSEETVGKENIPEHVKRLISGFSLSLPKIESFRVTFIHKGVKGVTIPPASALSAGRMVCLVQSEPNQKDLLSLSSPVFQNSIERIINETDALFIPFGVSQFLTIRIPESNQLKGLKWKKRQIDQRTILIIDLVPTISTSVRSLLLLSTSFKTKKHIPLKPAMSLVTTTENEKSLAEDLLSFFAENKEHLLSLLSKFTSKFQMAEFMSTLKGGCEGFLEKNPQILALLQSVLMPQKASVPVEAFDD